MPTLAFVARQLGQNVTRAHRDVLLRARPGLQQSKVKAARVHCLTLGSAPPYRPQTANMSTSSPSMSAGVDDDLIFRQLFDHKTCTYTYLLADSQTKEAILIDPVFELVERDLHLVHDLDLKLIYGVNTHVHADHVTGTGELKKKIPSCQSIISQNAKAQADVQVAEGDHIKFGRFELECRSTPGHTDGCTTYVLHGKDIAFTGDALLIRGCGRTDFQQGSASALYDSVHTKILSLPTNTKLYPAHDYTGQTVTTVMEELKFNKRLTKSKEEFIKIMDNLNLPYPKYIDKALPANMVCGVCDIPADDVAKA